MNTLPVHKGRTVYVLLACYVYGRLASLLPAPDDPQKFWVANLAAPFVLCAFIAGATRSSAAISTLCGAAAPMLMVAGFYRFDAVGRGVTWSQLDLDPSTSRWSIIADSYQRWFSTLLVGDTPWLSVAAIAGAFLGTAGFLAARNRSICAAVIGGVPVVEGLYHFSGAWSLGDYDYSLSNVAIWGAEVAVGVVLGLAIARPSYRQNGA